MGSEQFAEQYPLLTGFILFIIDVFFIVYGLIAIKNKKIYIPSTTGLNPGVTVKGSVALVLGGFLMLTGIFLLFVLPPISISEIHQLIFGK